jgi:hypothetical protein
LCFLGFLFLLDSSLFHASRKNKIGVRCILKKKAKLL